MNQPAPKPNDSRPVWELVIEDMKARDQMGRAKYGVPLQAGNGRDSLQDAMEEALDLVVYLRTAIEERKVTSYMQGLIALADRLLDLWNSQSEWSQATFGTDQQRGPIGGLRHLAKEANEAAEDPTNIVEYADCFLLILDASRRAGFSLGDLLDAAEAKHQVNKLRIWPKPAADDQPTEHIKTEGAQ